jgi:hypothetical protein
MEKKNSLVNREIEMGIKETQLSKTREMENYYSLVQTREIEMGTKETELNQD